MSKDDIGDRFKAYEEVFDFTLPRRLPMVIRVDGRAFHSLKLIKPFDSTFFKLMEQTAEALCRSVSGAVLAYFQSDEISVIARDDQQLNREPWVKKRLSKVLSLSAAIATVTFNAESHDLYGRCEFDSRAFVLPDLNEVTNYLIWRQQDATRNSVSMAAHAEFTHKSLQGVNMNGMLDRLREAGKPWEEVPAHFKRGAVCRPVQSQKYITQINDEVTRWTWETDLNVPIFTQNRSYIEDLYRLEK